jgi:hypothetical protein
MNDEENSYFLDWTTSNLMSLFFLIKYNLALHLSSGRPTCPIFNVNLPQHGGASWLTYWLIRSHFTAEKSKAHGIFLFLILSMVNGFLILHFVILCVECGTFGCTCFDKCVNLPQTPLSPMTYNMICYIVNYVSRWLSFDVMSRN